MITYIRLETPLHPQIIPFNTHIRDTYLTPLYLALFERVLYIK